MNEQPSLRSPRIITGEFNWEGNLNDYVQNIKIGVILPEVKYNGEKLNAKQFTEFCLMSRRDRHEQDHASIRLISLGQCFGKYTADVLALRKYVEITKGNKDYVYFQLQKLLADTWKGEYDYMIRLEKR